MTQTIMTVKDVAEIMGMGIHQAERLVRSSGFPAIKIGRRYFIPEEEFVKWVKRNSYSATPYVLD